MHPRNTRRTSRLIAAVGLAAATLSVGPQPAAATEITVTTSDSRPNDGLCSLEEAIIAANTNNASGSTLGECPAGGSGIDQIFLPPGTIFVPSRGLPTITSDLLVSSVHRTVILGTSVAAVPAIVVDGADLELSGVTVRGFPSGGIVSLDSNLEIADSWIDGNGNSNSEFGGVSFESTTGVGSLSIRSSTISNNATTKNGGGISIVGSVTGQIVNSTIADNTTSSTPGFDPVGGGVYFDVPFTSSSFTIDSSTIVGNNAPSGAGIYRTGPASLTVRNSIVADNLGAGGDVDGTGTYTSGGGNVIGNGTRTANFNGTDDITGQSAGVAALTENGGLTPTMALQPGSPAVDRITVATQLEDQRGVTRPHGARFDSGAFEFLQAHLTMLATPCTVYDSSTGAGPLTQSAVRIIPITLSCGVPANANAAVFNIFATNPQAPGNLRLSAAGVVPNGGVVNFANNGLNNSNTVTVALFPQGRVQLSANGGNVPTGTPLTDVRIQVVAYYSPDAGLDYFPLTPCTVADSRPTEGATGDFAGPFGLFDQMPAIDLVGTFPAGQGGGNTNCGVPATADAVVVNLVAVNATGPGGLAVGFASVVGFQSLGMNNAAVAYLNLNGGQTAQVQTFEFTGATTHIRAVILGYLDDTGAGTSYTPVNPCTAFDTRINENPTGAFAGLRAGDNVTTYQITGTIPAAQGGNGGNCGVPSNATAVLINLVAVNSVRAGNLQAYATGTTPTGGVVNFAALTPAMNNSNAVPVPISALGQMNIRTNAGPSGIGQPTTHIRGIILGYYTD